RTRDDRRRREGPHRQGGPGRGARRRHGHRGRRLHGRPARRLAAGGALPHRRHAQPPHRGPPRRPPRPPAAPRRRTRTAPHTRRRRRLGAARVRRDPRRRAVRGGQRLLPRARAHHAGPRRGRGETRGDGRRPPGRAPRRLLQARPGTPRPLRRPERRGPAHHRQRAEPGRRPRDRTRRHGSGTRMILTVTPNPSLDRTYEVPSLARGEVVRATGERVDPGGKGVNVSRAVAAAGQRTVAVLPLGGAPGALVAQLLDAQGIEVAPVPVEGPTRSNIALAEADGVLTKINAPGPELTAAEQELLLRTVHRQSEGADWIACCGSLPRGLDPSWYAELVTRAHSAGVRIALDTSGPALLAALRGQPDVVKPNAEELAEAVGRPLATVGDAAKAAGELREMGARAVLASLGADGQLLVDADGTWFGTARVETVRSNVGAGDSSLAGFLIAGGRGPEALASAVAHGAAAVQTPGSVMPSPGDLDPSAVTVTADVPADRPLKEPVT